MFNQNSSVKPLKIFLCDLTHNVKQITTASCMPLGIGLVATHALKKFGDKIEVKLFKYPEKLLEALKSERCDIIGCSTYVWNHNLALWACRKARELNPSVVTCLGGPDFPLLEEQQISYFEAHNYIDFKIIYEGEVAFSNIISIVLDRVDNDSLFEEAVGGCTFLNRKNNLLIKGSPITLKNLDESPSPYINGLLDEFFDGNFVPIIHTTRGCPFSCNFCVESDKFYNNVRRVDRDEAIAELQYIGERISKTSVKMLSIADSNYGMYKQDKIISETIAELQRQYDWPLGIYVSTGKKFEPVMANTEVLRGSFDFSMSVQSMDKVVLEEIGRRNIPPEKYREAGETLKAAGQPTLAETIVPLPKETLNSYLDGVRELIEWGVQRIVTNSLMIIYGTEYKDPKFLEKYAYQTRYRLLPSYFGEFDGEKIFEYEEFGISTNTFSFNDYIAVRRVSFLLEVLFNSSILYETELFLADYDIGFYDFFIFVYGELDKAPEKVQNVFNSYDKESRNEIKHSPSELIEFYSNPKNYQDLLSGEIGGNVKFKHKAMLFSAVRDDWIGFVFDCLEKFVKTKHLKNLKVEIGSLKNYMSCRLHGVLEGSKTTKEIEQTFNHDLESWIAQEKREKKLSEFQIETGVKYRFAFDDRQKTERNQLFSKHDAGNLIGLTNILSAIRPQQRLYRKVERLS